MADPNMMATDESAGMPEEQGAEPAQQGYCIELHVGADGSMKISVEPEEEEQGEEQTADQSQPVQGLKEALSVIIDIVKNGGQVADAAAGEGDFAAGFNEDTSGNAPAQAKRFA